jgi:uncharacterized membrane protein
MPAHGRKDGRTPDATTPASELPRHVEESVRSVAELHIEHYATATVLDRILERATAVVGHPVTLGATAGVALIWLVGKIIEPGLGLSLTDPPAWLDRAVGLASIYLVLLILATQRRADRLAQRRDQLTLELALVNEQKIAKVVELLEELRRDHPQIADRLDSEAEAMAESADPASVLVAIERRHGPAR